MLDILYTMSVSILFAIEKVLTSLSHASRGKPAEVD